MRKIKKIYVCIGIVLWTICSFSFQISEVRFDKIIKKGTTGTKDYILANNTNSTKLYKLSVDKEKNIKVTPNVIELAPLDSKKISIKVIGNEKKGKYTYFFIIKEINKSTKENSLNINKTVKIKQEYTIK